MSFRAQRAMYSARLATTSKDPKGKVLTGFGLHVQLGAVLAAQALHHAVDALDVVVAAADELEQALLGVLPQDPSTCRPDTARGNSRKVAAATAWRTVEYSRTKIRFAHQRCGHLLEELISAQRCLVCVWNT